MQSVSVIRKSVVLALVLALSGCSMDSILPDREIDYKTQARTEKSLEVPPDLTQPSQDDTMAVRDLSPSGTASYSTYAGERRAERPADGRVLPDQDNLRLEHEGDRFWLVAQGEPAQIWPKAREFWLENGFLLELDNPEIGIMETTWAENRADIPQGPVRRLIGTVFDSLYSAATRDRFRVRLERGEQPGTTEVFLTHKGVEEEEQGESGTVWRPRPRDPELEAEMLKRLMVHLGIEQQRAQRIVATRQVEEPPNARLAGSRDAPALVLDEPFSRAWRTTGLALDRIGFNVQDRDRAEGLYYVRYEDPEVVEDKEGFLSNLAFWRGKEEPEVMYQVHLQSEGAATLIQVRDREGHAVTSQTGRRILTLLHEELK